MLAFSLLFIRSPLYITIVYIFLVLLFNNYNYYCDYYYYHHYCNQHHYRYCTFH